MANWKLTKVNGYLPRYASFTGSMFKEF